MLMMQPRQLAAATLAVTACFFVAACTEENSDQLVGLDITKVVGEQGYQVGQFVYPRGMDIFHADGKTYAVVVDKTARIQQVDLETGQTVGALHTPRWDRGKPTGLTVCNSVLDPSKLAVYVADTHEFRVLMYELPLPNTLDPQPTEPDWEFGEYGREPGQFIYPTDIAVQTDNDGVVNTIFVSEYGGNDRINRFAIDRSADTPAVQWEMQLGVVSEEVDASDHPIGLSRPQSIELWDNPTTKSREIVLTDASHHRIGRLTTDGELITWYGDPLDTSEDAYRFPYGLTILEDGTALIAEFGGNRITCIDIESGDRVFRYGAPGRSVGQIAQPWAVGTDGEQIVILDSGNSRIQFSRPPRVARPISPEYTDPSPSTPTPSGGMP